MDPIPSEAKNPVKSTQTTFRILDALAELERARVTQIADHLDLSKSSVHSYLTTLEQEGYVVKDGHTYMIGLGFLTLGIAARNRHPIYDVARPEVDHLAAETGEVANLLVEENGMGVYLYRARGERAVNMDTSEGKRVHLHNTALGKAILAHMSESDVDRIIDRYGLPGTTEGTITDRDALFAELEGIADRGLAYDREERLEGLRCVAKPIVSSEGRVHGAMSVAGPSSRMRGDRLEEDLPELLDQAVNVVEVNLTYG